MEAMALPSWRERWEDRRTREASRCPVSRASLLLGASGPTVFPGGSDGKQSACSAGDLGSTPGSERSPGEGNGNPLQYSRLENPMDRGYSPWDCRVGHNWATNLTYTLAIPSCPLFHSSSSDPWRAGAIWDQVGNSISFKSNPGTATSQMWRCARSGILWVRVSWFSASGCCEAKVSLCCKVLRANHHQPPSPLRSPAQDGRAVPRLPAGPRWLVPLSATSPPFTYSVMVTNWRPKKWESQNTPSEDFTSLAYGSAMIMTSTSSHCRPASQSQHSRTVAASEPAPQTSMQIWHISSIHNRPESNAVER